MLAHIIHDADGTVRSVIFQSPEIEGGELEIESENDDDLITIVNLEESFPEIAVDAGAGLSRHHLYVLARDIRTNFRVDSKRKTLERQDDPVPV
jgi:hypothetical protein